MLGRDHALTESVNFRAPENRTSARSIKRRESCVDDVGRDQQREGKKGEWKRERSWEGGKYTREGRGGRRDGGEREAE